MATAVTQAPPWRRRLYLPSYRASDAARYVRAHPSTISAWLYRHDLNLPERTKGSPLSYLELVEVAFVAFFRRLEISMKRITDARSYIAQNIASEYPFAEHTFKTEGFHILMNYDEFDPYANWDSVIVADAQGQLAWTDLMGERFAEFDYEHEIAIRWHPAGRDSQVTIDPRVAFGAPMVSGLPTWVIRGRFDSGETIPEIADDFGIEETAVQDALAFENRQVA